MIDYTVRNHVAEILFNHAPANTINHEFLDTLIASLQKAGADNEVRAILIGSAIPDRFCAGLDLAGLLRGPPPKPIWCARPCGRWKRSSTRPAFCASAAR